MEGEEEVEEPSLVFTKSVMGQIQKEDVLAMVEAQREMLMRYEKTNEMLLNFNMLSGTRYETTMLEFRKHTTLLYEMKKDLDAIFRRIRLLKGRLSTLYPAAFSACSDVYNVLEEKNGEKAEEGEGEKSKTEGEVNENSQTEGDEDEADTADAPTGSNAAPADVPKPQVARNVQASQEDKPNTAQEKT